MQDKNRPADEAVEPAGESIAGNDSTSETVVQADLPPETHNAEQDDEDSQAQTLAEEALGRRSDFEASGSEQAPSPGDDSGGMPDLVDHMNQMVSSGRIDMSAFRGERNDDDEDGALGNQGLEEDFPRGAN